MVGFIGSEKKPISLVELKAFPPFLRFGKVYLQYWFGVQTITEKCQLFNDFLPSIKGALDGPNETIFSCRINQHVPSEFSNHSTLVGYIRDGLLPIYDSPRRYKFNIYFYSDKNSCTEVIASILKMPQIVRCSNIVIRLYQIHDPVELPNDEIAQWLNQITDRIGFIGKKVENKCLKIVSDNIGNILGIYED